MLTIQDLQTLQKPFQPRDHEFLKGMPYIREDSITSRIEDVDPAWSMDYVETIIRNDKITVVVQLTVKGVSRVGVGTQSAAYRKGAEHTPDNETNEPEKSAVTDALKRAARLFGIGRYLLSVPKHVSDENSIKQWLITNYLPTTQQAPRRESAPPPADNDEAPESSKPEHWVFENGKGATAVSTIKSLGLSWDNIKDQIEPGRTLERMSDTSLSFDEFRKRIDLLAIDDMSATDEPKAKKGSGKRPQDNPLMATATKKKKNQYENEEVA